MTNRTIGGLVDQAAAINGSRQWLHFGDSVTTFSELQQRTDNAAAELANLGIRQRRSRRLLRPQPVPT